MGKELGEVDGSICTLVGCHGSNSIVAQQILSMSGRLDPPVDGQSGQRLGKRSGTALEDVLSRALTPERVSLDSKLEAIVTERASLVSHVFAVLLTQHEQSVTPYHTLQALLSLSEVIRQSNAQPSNLLVQSCCSCHCSLSSYPHANIVHIRAQSRCMARVCTTRMCRSMVQRLNGG